MVNNFTFAQEENIELNASPRQNPLLSTQVPLYKYTTSSDSDFIKTNDIVKSLKAIKHYSVDDSHCSAVVTSSSCLGLTAAHCFRDYLEKHKKIDWTLVADTTPAIKFGNVDVKHLPIKIERQKDKKDSMFITRNGLAIKKLLQTEDSIELIALGDGMNSWNTFPDSFTSNNYDSAQHFLTDFNEFTKYTKQTKSGVLSDYAVVRLPGDKCECAPTQDEIEGNNFISAGYGEEALFIASLFQLPISSDIVTPHSSGNLVCGPFESNFTKAYKSLTFIQKVYIQLRFPNHLYNVNKIDIRTNAILSLLPNEILVTTARISGGASGGGTLDEKGSLVGINIQLNRLPNNSVQTVSLKVSEIKEQLKNKISTELYTELFNCEK